MRILAILFAFGICLTSPNLEAGMRAQKFKSFCVTTVKGVHQKSLEVQVKAKVSWLKFKSIFKKPPQSPQKKQKQPKSQEARYPRFDRTSKAYNKDTEGDESKAERKVVAAVNDPNVLYFTSTRHSLIDPHSATSSAAAITRSKEIKGWGHPNKVLELELFPIGAKGQANQALIPAGTEPIGVKGGELWRDNTGNYIFRTSEDKIQVELGIPEPRPLTLKERTHLTAIEKISVDVWPDWLKTKIIELKAAYDSKKISEGVVVDELANTIQAQKYRVKDSQENGVFELANCGKFQCDGSRNIAVSILRAHFGIPCQAISGMTSVIDPQLPGHSVVIDPMTGHAWLEFYDSASQRWMLKDFTPTTPDQPKKESPANDRFLRRSPQAQQEKEKQKKDEKEKGQQTAQPDFAKIPESQMGDEWAKDWLAQILKDPTNVARVGKQLEEFKAGLETAPIGPLQKAELLRKVAELEKAIGELGHNSTSADEFVKNIRAVKNEAGVTRNIIPDLKYLEKSLEILQGLEGLTQQEAQTLRELRALRAEMFAADPKKNEALANSFLEMLQDGAIAPAIVRNKYTDPTSFRLDMSRLAKDLANGDELLLQLANLAKARKYLNLWSPPNQKPHIRMHDPEPVVVGETEEIEVARDFPDPGAIIWSGGTTPMTVIQQFIHGDLLYRQAYFRPAEILGTEKARPHSVSVLMFDATTSMNWNNAGRARNLLTSSYIDGAQRLTNLGREVHTIYQFAFGTQPHAATKAENLKQSMDLVTANLEYDSALNEGTEFTAPLVGAFGLAEEIHKKDNSVVRISIVLVTDSDGGVDLAKVLAARDRLSKGIEVVINLISLGNKENPSLKSLAESSGPGRNDLGQVTYIHIKEDEFDKLVAAPEILATHDSEKHETSRMQVVKSDWFPKIEQLLLDAQTSEKSREQRDPLASELYAKLNHRTRQDQQGNEDPSISEFIRSIIPRTQLLSRQQKLSVLYRLLEGEAGARRESLDQVIQNMARDRAFSLLHWIDGG